MAQTTALSQDQLTEFREVLQIKRREVLSDIDQLGRELDEAKDPNDTGGGLSNLPTHPADRGSDEYDRELNTRKMLRLQSLLNEIDDAIDRIEDGTYGLCMGTGKPITIERLRAKPWAKYSLDYEREMER